MASLCGTGEWRSKHSQSAMLVLMKTAWLWRAACAPINRLTIDVLPDAGDP